MDCKEFVKEIPDFIDRKQNYFKLRDFCGHMDTCLECREELVIQFLVTEGMLRLEDGDTFDLQRELDARMEEAKKAIRSQAYALEVGFVAEIFFIVGVLGFLIWLLF